MRSERIASAVGLVAPGWCSLAASIHPFRLTKAVPCRIDEESGARWRNRTPVAAVQRASPATDGIGQNGATRRNQTSVSALRGARSVTELWRRKWTNRRRVRSAPRGMRPHKRRPILDVHDAKHLRRDGVLGSAPSCRTGGGVASQFGRRDCGPMAKTNRWVREFFMVRSRDRRCRLCQRKETRSSIRRTILAKLSNFDFICFKIRCSIGLLEHAP